MYFSLFDTMYMYVYVYKMYMYVYVCIYNVRTCTYVHCIIMCIILRLYNVVQWVLDLCDGEVTQLLLGVPTCLSVHHVYRFHMDLRKAGSTRVEPGRV